MTKTSSKGLKETACKEEDCLMEDKSRASLYLLKRLSHNQDGVVNTIANTAGKYLKVDKVKALNLLLAKIAEQQDVIATEATKTVNSSLKLNKSGVVSLGILSVFLFSMAQGHCAGPDAGGLDTVTKGVTDVVFGSGVKKSILVLAAAGGLAQCFFTGSYKPLLVWGGLGLAFAYVPRLVEIIANVG